MLGLKIYRVVVDVNAPGGDYIVLAESEEEAMNYVRPSYTIDLYEEYDDIRAELLSDLNEKDKGVLHEYF